MFDKTKLRSMNLNKCLFKPNKTQTSINSCLNQIKLKNCSNRDGTVSFFLSFFLSFLPGVDTLEVYRACFVIDDLRKSRGLHSVSAYRHGLYILYRSMPAGVAQSSHAFAGGTVSTWAR